MRSAPGSARDASNPPPTIETARDQSRPTRPDSPGGQRAGRRDPGRECHPHLLPCGHRASMDSERRDLNPSFPSSPRHAPGSPSASGPI
eukprot:scaffold27357_cov160-Isochrysis_galbana.AAC.1